MVAKIARKQVIRERSAIVGLDTGKVYATLDENGARDPETVSIRNPGQKMKAGKISRVRGARPYALGGDLSIEGGADPNDPNIQAKIASGQVYYNSATNSVSSRPATAITAPTFTGAAGISSPGATQTQSAIYNAQSGQLDARGQAIAASRTQLGASVNADAAQTALLAEQQRSAQAQAADEARLLAAQNDTQGNQAAAQAQNYRNTQDVLYRAGGLPSPVVYNTPGGAQPANSPLGTVARIQTPADVVQSQNQGNASQRQLQDTTARIAASSASLGATVAGRAVTAANLDESQAALDQSRASLAPAGEVYDSYSGTFMTPAAQSVAQAQRSIVQDPVNKDFVTRQDLMNRTDANGNILRTSDNTWVDPDTGNELLGNTWTNPKSGGIYDAQANVWNYPNGDTYVPGPGKNGAGGYTMNKWGWHKTSDGEYQDPLTGNRLLTDYTGDEAESQALIDQGKAIATPQGLIVFAPQRRTAATGITIDPTTGDQSDTTAAPPPGGKNEPRLGAPVPPTEALKPITTIFPQSEWKNATKIALAESSGQNTAISPPNKDGSRDYGTFQINQGWFPELTRVFGTPVNAATILDTELNTRAAFYIFTKAGNKWSDWTTAKKLGLS